jgi:hypothetical protein
MWKPLEDGLDGGWIFYEQFSGGSKLDR